MFTESQDTQTNGSNRPNVIERCLSNFYCILSGIQDCKMFSIRYIFHTSDN